MPTDLEMLDRVRRARRQPAEVAPEQVRPEGDFEPFGPAPDR